MHPLGKGNFNKTPMGWVWSIPLGVAILSQTLFGLGYDVLLKREGKVFNLLKADNGSVEESLPLRGNLPLFSHFEVKEEKGKLFLVWKTSNPSVEGILIVTDVGKVIRSSKSRLTLKVPQGVRFLRVYPVDRNGRLGLPAEVYLDG